MIPGYRTSFLTAKVAKDKRKGRNGKKQILIPKDIGTLRTLRQDFASSAVNGF
jgi:hypothetical protein